MIEGGARSTIYERVGRSDWYKLGIHVCQEKERDTPETCTPVEVRARVYQSSRICRASRGERKTGQERSRRTVSPRRRRSGWNNLPCLVEEKLCVFPSTPRPLLLVRACISFSFFLPSFLPSFLFLFSHSRPISYRRVITRHEHAPCIHPTSPRPVSKIEKPASQRVENLEIPYRPR